ncbi:hypothetical protein ALP32_200036 [Pseudomonas avellanae]|uniref:Uncharacterized protein n=1 Tax=Pseudomonas avellanae TaxID=46257 RepID=A0A3M5U3D1_9PSED|nr:hypothetical protein ALP32_200036 [Pseudomonas avellanae]
MLENVEPAQCNRQAHPQPSTGSRAAKRQGVFHIVQILKNTHTPLIKNLAVVGHAQAASGAVEQAYLQTSLKPDYRLPHRRASEPQLLRRRSEAASIYGAYKGGNVVQVVEFHGGLWASTFGRFSTWYGEPYSPIRSIVSPLSTPLPNDQLRSL